MKYNFPEPVRMQVYHDRFEMLEVMAYNPMDAKLQAGTRWECGDYLGMRVAIEKKAIAALLLDAEREQVHMEPEG